jgi:hypothetical protein
MLSLAGVYSPPAFLPGINGQADSPKPREKKFGKRWIVQYGTAPDKKAGNLSKSCRADNG